MAALAGSIGGRPGNALWDQGRISLSPLLGSSLGEPENTADRASVMGLFGARDMAPKPESLVNPISQGEMDLRKASAKEILGNDPISQVNVNSWSKMRQRSQDDYDSLAYAVMDEKLKGKGSLTEQEAKDFEENVMKPKFNELLEQAKTNPTDALASLREMVSSENRAEDERQKGLGNKPVKRKDPNQVFYFPYPVTEKEDGKDVSYFYSLYMPKDSNTARLVKMRSGSNPGSPKAGEWTWDKVNQIK